MYTEEFHPGSPSRDDSQSWGRWQISLRVTHLLPPLPLSSSLFLNQCPAGWKRRLLRWEIRKPQKLTKMFGCSNYVWLINQDVTLWCLSPCFTYRRRLFNSRVMLWRLPWQVFSLPRWWHDAEFVRWQRSSLYQMWDITGNLGICLSDVRLLNLSTRWFPTLSVRCALTAASDEPKGTLHRLHLSCSECVHWIHLEHGCAVSASLLTCELVCGAEDLISGYICISIKE